MTIQTLTDEEKAQLYNSKILARRQILVVHSNLRSTLQNNKAWDKDVREQYDDVIKRVEKILITLNTEINQLYKSLN